MDDGSRQDEYTLALFVLDEWKQPARSVVAAAAAGNWNTRTAGSWALQAGLGAGLRSWCVESAASMVWHAAGVAEAASLWESTGELDIVANTGAGWMHTTAFAHRQGSAAEASAVGN
jgi:hypothetical protein